MWEIKVHSQNDKKTLKQIKKINENKKNKGLESTKSFPTQEWDHATWNDMRPLSCVRRVINVKISVKSVYPKRVCQFLSNPETIAQTPI